MARAKRTDTLQRRLLSFWEPPEGAGAAIGVIATTFTLDTAFFEEECLARFAQVQSDAARDGALYRIEREEKLSSLLCAAVVADIRHCAGRRSLRWDLLAARPASGVMHAKISLMVWANHVRVLIGSANLTNDGYRRNQESVAPLEFGPAFTDRGLLDPLLAYLRELLSLTTGPARERAEQLLSWVDRQLPRHVAPGAGVQRHILLVGPRRPSVFEQIKQIIPQGAPPGVAHVVSPFFDPILRQGGPELALWGLMKQRGPAELHFHVAGDEVPESRRWRLEVPKHVLSATPKGRAGVFTALHPVKVMDVPTDFGLDRRPLHAKTLTLTHEKWAALTVGSSNFTSPGTGLSPRARNYEANVLYLVRASDGDNVRSLLETRQLRGGAAVTQVGDVDFDPALDTDGEDESTLPPLPSFFAEAVLKEARLDGYLLVLTFDDPEPAGAWIVRFEHAVVANSDDWRSGGQPLSFELTLKREGPPPSTLNVQWGDAKHVADWPVNVTSASSLPEPTELQELTLAALLDLLSSAQPLHEALRSWLRRQPDDDDTDVEEVVELVDPHAKVDTSGFLVKRVQRACWALRQLRERLEQPVLSASAMAWRVNGPVGANAVLNAIDRQCDPTLPDELAFLLCEMWRELKHVNLQGVGQHEVPRESQELLTDFVTCVRDRLMFALPACSASMQSYVAKAIQDPANEVA